MKPSSIRWLLLDRSNGDSHRHWPTYVFVHTTRAAARRQKMQHQHDRRLSRLEGPRRVGLLVVQRRYVPVAGCVDSRYWELKARSPEARTP
jgi:hypothetical protein